MLSTLGLTADEECVYLRLLELPGHTASALEEHLTISRRRIDDALTALHAKGLLSRSATSPPRHLPVSPDAALEVLILQREEELQRARVEATRLGDRFRRTARQPEAGEVIQIIEGVDVIVQWVDRLVRGARHEIVGFDKSPLEDPGPEFVELKLDLLRRGVEVRGVCDWESLQQPWRARLLSQTGAAGELWRTIEHLPLRLLIIDRRVAILPLSLECESQRAIVVHHSALLESLTMLFGLIWCQATPIAMGGDAPPTPAPRERFQPSETDLRVLSLIAAGLTDEAISRHLGVGKRTVERRMSVLMHRLGAHTRAQGLLMASRKGWLLERRHVGTEPVGEQRTDARAPSDRAGRRVGGASDQLRVAVLTVNARNRATRELTETSVTETPA